MPSHAQEASTDDLKDSSTTPKSSLSTASYHLEHNRKRSASTNQIFISATQIPAPSQNAALASLIANLASISGQGRDRTRQPSRNAAGRAYGHDLLDEITADPTFAAQFQGQYPQPQPSIAEEEEGDNNACPFPVAGYTKVDLPPRPKTSGVDARPPSRYSTRSRLSVDTTRSGRRNFFSSETAPPLPYAQSRRNESAASLSRSVKSNKTSKSQSRGVFGRFFGAKSAETYQDHFLRFSPSPENTPRQTLEFRQPSEDKEAGLAALTPSSDRDRPTRISAFITLPRGSSASGSSKSGHRTLSSISPSVRSNLEETLIPSRRSSLQMSRKKKASPNSKDLRSLNIDQDLIEENHSTVQRIKELQEAREKRHKEWRKDAKRSEKLAKRMSLREQSPSRRNDSVRNSWHIQPTETPVQEQEMATPTPQISEPTTASILPRSTTLPALTPQPPSFVNSELKRNLSLTQSTTASLNSDRRHKKRLSDGLKRLSSFNQHAQDDIKRIEEEVEAYLAGPRFTQKVRHPRTGRTICFSEVGDPNGFVVICCVGMGLTRYTTTFYDEVARTHRLRILTLDRPGVGETDPMPDDRTTPLSWVDDVAVICTAMNIEKFSLLAHSAGAIYALATALKMPQYVRGQIHLLAPWIPPSQLTANSKATNGANLPTSHKVLSFLPASFMKVANSRFLNINSASIDKQSRQARKEQREAAANLVLDPVTFAEEASLTAQDISVHTQRMAPLTPIATPILNSTGPPLPAHHTISSSHGLLSPPVSPLLHVSGQRGSMISPITSRPPSRSASSLSHHTNLRNNAHYRSLYNSLLTTHTWHLSTHNANPASDLIICLERRRLISFRYTDVTRSVVIRHGLTDNRVPLSNVQWLAEQMKRCELRVLETEGHGLMASASVMSDVLGEIGGEWADWENVVRKKEVERLKEELEVSKERERARVIGGRRARGRDSAIV